MFLKKSVHIFIAFVLAIVALSLLVQNLKADNGSYTCDRWTCKARDVEGVLTGKKVYKDTRLEIIETKVVVITVKSWWGRTSQETVTLGHARWAVYGESWYNLANFR